MGEVIAITSGKGGVGKTTMTAGLGAALASMGKKVLAVDLDIGTGDLDMKMRLENKVVYNLLDVLEGSCKILQALVKDPEQEMLYLLPSPASRDMQSVSARQLIRLMQIFKKEFDYVLIDTKAGMGDSFLNAIASADRALIVTTPDRAALKGTMQLLHMLDPEKLRRSALLINRLRLDLLKTGETMDPEALVEKAGLPLLGITLEDDDILLMSDSEGSVIDVASVACRSFKNTAGRILGENIPIVLKGRK